MSAQSTNGPRLNELAERLAPEIRFHSRDQFGPCSLEWLLARSELTAHWGDLTWASGGRIYLPSSMSLTKAGPLFPADILAATQSTDYRDSSRNVDVGIWPMAAPPGQQPSYTQPTDSWYFSDYQRQTLVGEIAPTAVPTAVEGSACYVHITREADWYLITYYFLCAYNGAMGPTTAWAAPPLAGSSHGGGFEQHYGDVMRIAARVTFDPASRTYSLLAVELDAHGETTVVSHPPFSFSRQPLEAVPSLVVYSAWHSHEMYPDAGTHSLPGPAVGHDYTDDGGLHWITRNSLVFVAGGDPGWVNYNGNVGNNVHYSHLGIDVLTTGTCLFTFKSAWARGYRNGMRLRDSATGRIYLMIDYVLRHVPNPPTYENLFATWEAVPITLGNLPAGDPLTDGAYLVKGDLSARWFFVVDGTKRWIASPLVLATYGFEASKVRIVAQATVDAIPEGAPLATQTGHLAEGSRPRNGRDGRIFLVLDGLLRHVPDPATYNKLFKDWSGLIELPNVQNYLVGPAIPEDASLAKASGPEIYLLIDGVRRWIPSPAIFGRYDFSPAAVRTLSDDALRRIPAGPNLV
jgi:hypothetical protein